MEQAERSCENRHPCECYNTSCEHHGKCCECVANHKAGGDLPVCLRNLKK